MTITCEKCGVVDGAFHTRPDCGAALPAEHAPPDAELAYASKWIAPHGPPFICPVNRLNDTCGMRFQDRRDFDEHVKHGEHYMEYRWAAEKINAGNMHAIHAAWRKRAEEAEAELAGARTSLAGPDAVAPLVELADEYISGAHRDSTAAQRPEVIRDFVKWALGRTSLAGRGPDAKVTRIEVIDHREGAPEVGRVFTAWNSVVELSYQDNGRTLKVFVTGRAGLSKGEETT